MENDDRPVGRILSRREVLALFGGTGIGILSPALTAPSGAATTDATVPKAAGCVAKPELEIGPYFVDEKINRSDVRSDPTTGVAKPGVLLQLTFNVTDANNNCAPIEGAMVDIWQCDAVGLYSDQRANGTVGQKFLRGYQLTNANGVAQFTTIYPGWYGGRTIHIHFRIRQAAAGGKTYDFISQVFFPEAVTDQVHAQQPYAAHGIRDTKNSWDHVYNQGGSQLLLALTQTTQGYAATIDIGLVETTGQSRRSFQGGPQGGPPQGGFLGGGPMGGGPMGGGPMGGTGGPNWRGMLRRAGFAEAKVQDAVIAFATAQSTAHQSVRDSVREITEQAQSDLTTDAQARALLDKLRDAINAEKKRAKTAAKELDEQIGYTKKPRLELPLATMGLIGEASYLGDTGMSGGFSGPGNFGGPPGGFGGPPGGFGGNPGGPGGWGGGGFGGPGGWGGGDFGGPGGPPPGGPGGRGR